MFKWVFLAFIIIPLCELLILIQLSHVIGILGTLGLILLTAAGGVTLARWQGLQVMRQMQDAMQANRFPSNEILDGLMVLAAAAVLLTPGLITDITAFLFLLPVTRAPIKQFILKRIQAHYVDHGIVTVNTIDIDPSE